VFDSVVYDVWGNRLMSGPEIFGELKQDVSWIYITFIGKDKFVAYSMSGREDLILFVCAIADGR